MPSISATSQISGGDLANLQALPQQLKTLVGNAHQSLKSITGGSAADNPISALLGNLNGLGGQAANLPDLGPILEPIQSLVKDLPSTGLVNLGQWRNGIEETLGV